MANLKYPSGIKGKSSMAWIGMAFMTFSPYVMFFQLYLSKEHYHGNTLRLTFAEEAYFTPWINTDYRHSSLFREEINRNPNYAPKILDRLRSRHGVLSI